jgi:hypothetical protein
MADINAVELATGELNAVTGGFGCILGGANCLARGMANGILSGAGEGVAPPLTEPTGGGNKGSGKNGGGGIALY